MKTDEVPKVHRPFVNLFQAELQYRGFRFSKPQVMEIIRAFCDSMFDAVKAGMEVRIPRLGKFYFKTRKAHLYKMPNGEETFHEKTVRLGFKQGTAMATWVKRWRSEENNGEIEED